MRFDDSTQYQAPKLTALTSFEIAVLRDGRRGVIYVALFNLWLSQQIAVSVTKRKAEINSVVSNPPNKEFETIIFNFIGQKICNPYDFFKNKALNTRLDKAIKPIEHQLETWHLKKTQLQKEQEQKQAKQVFNLTAMLISLAEVIMPTSDEFISINVILLLSIGIMSWIIDHEYHTRLGKEYLKKLTEHYKFLSNSKDSETVNPVQLIAVLGLAGLEKVTAYSSFLEAFKSTEGKLLKQCTPRHFNM